MAFTLTFESGEKRTFDKKVSLLSLLEGHNPDLKYIAAEVNNVTRELTYEVYYDADIRFLTLSDSTASKIYEATLRYVVAMAFARTYPDLKIRFAYNVSRCVSIHLLNPGATSTTAMLLKVRHEIGSILEHNLRLTTIIEPNVEAGTV